jgi:hypothetical protein
MMLLVGGGVKHWSEGLLPKVLLAKVDSQSSYEFVSTRL